MPPDYPSRCATASRQAAKLTVPWWVLVYRSFEDPRGEQAPARARRPAERIEKRRR